MKKILLATDGSEFALHAAKFLARLPHDDRVEITVMTALYVPASNRSYLTGDWVQICKDEDQKRAEKEFSAIECLFDGANVSLKHVVREGVAGEAIVAVIREVEPELVVLGAVGHSALSRVLLGSTSDYVATHAPCSVLIVRPSGAPEGDHPLRIAVGYEETAPAQAALEEFCEISWGREPDIRLVNVSYIAGFYEEGVSEKASNAVEAAAEGIRRVAPLAKGVHLEGDHIGESLVQYVERENIDLLVVGETPRNRLGRVLMGSMTRFALRHAPCSIWIARNRMIQGLAETGDLTRDEISS